MKEAILAKRIEGALTKPQILEIYLNTIFLGRNAYGVEAASHAYFDKDLDELTLPQFAYLAILPKGPANYDPDRNTARALRRRNWVLGEMLRNEFINQAQHDAAVATPLGTAPRQAPKFERAGGYFVEEVRRQLIDKFGENATFGPVQRLFGRAVGADVVRSDAAAICAGSVARRPDALRRRARLDRAARARLGRRRRLARAVRQRQHRPRLQGLAGRRS